MWCSELVEMDWLPYSTATTDDTQWDWHLVLGQTMRVHGRTWHQQQPGYTAWLYTKLDMSFHPRLPCSPYAILQYLFQSACVAIYSILPALATNQHCTKKRSGVTSWNIKQSLSSNNEKQHIGFPILQSPHCSKEVLLVFVVLSSFDHICLSFHGLQ